MASFQPEQMLVLMENGALREISMSISWPTDSIQSITVAFQHPVVMQRSGVLNRIWIGLKAKIVAANNTDGFHADGDLVNGQYVAAEKRQKIFARFI